MPNAMHGISRFEDAVKLLDTKDDEIHRLRQIITAAFEDLRDGKGATALHYLRNAAMAFPSVPQAPAGRDEQYAAP